ncbi:Superfamily II DNA or RNA helicase OS=Streptomyces griseomycini OX=66895 GN=FHS37_005216 PE=4 SV=1 [Streptomyces griseomycini]
MEEANKEQDEDTGEQEQFSFEALESEAVFDRVLYDGAEFGMQAHPGSEEEQDYLGIPGLLEPDQVQMLLQKRQARQIAHSRKKPDDEADLLELPAERRPVVSHKEMMELRKQLNRMVGAYVHQLGSRTGSSTPSCGACAAARRAPRPRPESCGSGSPRCRKWATRMR